ncbi:glycerophosphodiester phosphodiesterase family protein [Dermabacter hominis]|uniref:glycerophosphodiester phosphodiesterase family protein n=1 Tax=Dermabacter hominis TaxID=36740 RepID=UPI00316ACC81|nr:glycerophosphodiester phosphodiesterase family protein [Dermabacter hominis]
MKYTHRVQVSAPFDVALEAVRHALAEEGFGVVYELNMQGTLSNKIGAEAGAELGPYVILGACIPALARRALNADPSMGALLPCNVVVRAGESYEQSIVECIDPTVMSGLSRGEEVRAMTEDADHGLRTVLASIDHFVPARGAGTGAPAAVTEASAVRPPQASHAVGVEVAGVEGYRPVIVGHRGAALVTTENTLAGFRQAKTDGAAVVECDVHLSADGTPIIMHDETIDRMADPSSIPAKGAIKDLTNAELSQVSLQGGHGVPLLTELLAMDDLELYVEVKVASAATASAQLIHDKRPGHGERDTVISFVPEALAAVHEVAPHVGLGLLVNAVEESTWDTLEELGCTWLSCSVDGLTPEAAKEAHARGYKINVWTVNTEEQLAKAVELRPESISTDDPRWAIEQLAAR